MRETQASASHPRAHTVDRTRTRELSADRRRTSGLSADVRETPTTTADVRRMPGKPPANPATASHPAFASHPQTPHTRGTERHRSAPKCARMPHTSTADQHHTDAPHLTAPGTKNTQAPTPDMRETPGSSADVRRMAGKPPAHPANASHPAFASHPRSSHIRFATHSTPGQQSALTRIRCSAAAAFKPRPDSSDSRVQAATGFKRQPGSSGNRVQAATAFKRQPGSSGSRVQTTAAFKPRPALGQRSMLVHIQRSAASRTRLADHA